MARLPTFGEAPRSDKMSIELGRAAMPDRRYAGAEWDARGRAVKGLGDFASELIMKRVESNNKNSAANAYQEFKVLANEQVNQAKLSAKEDFKGYGEDVNNRLTTLKDKITENLDGGAIDYFNSEASPFFASQRVKADDEEFLGRENYFVKSKGQVVDEDSALLRSKPDPIDAVGYFNSLKRIHLQPIEGVSLTSVSAKKLEESAREKYRFAVFQGNLENGNLEMAKDFIEGNIRGTEDLLEGLDAKEKDKYLDQLQSKAKSMNQSSLMNALEKASDSATVLQKGEANPAIMQEINANEAHLKQLKDIDPENASRIDDALVTLNAAKQVNAYTASIPFKNIKDIPKSDNIFKSDNLQEAAVNIRAKALYDAAVAENIRERNQDPAAYVKKYFGAMSPQDNYNKQITLGILEPRMIDKSESASFASIYRNMPSAEDKTQLLKQINSQYGDKANYVLQDIANDNKDMAYLFHVNNMSEEVRRDLIKAREMQANKQFDAESLQAAGITKSQVYASSGRYLQKFKDVISDTGDTINNID